jgi:hypothetical protein
MAPRARFELATLRLTAETIKNPSALSGVACKKTGAIFLALVAPNSAPKPILTIAPPCIDWTCQGDGKPVTRDRFIWFAERVSPSWKFQYERDSNPFMLEGAAGGEPKILIQRLANLPTEMVESLNPARV